MRTRLLDRRGGFLLAFLILAAVLLGASFGPHLRGEFVWDDIYLVEGNQALFRADGWRVLVLHDLWGPVTGKPSQLYHPVPMLSLWLQGMARSVPWQTSGWRTWRCMACAQDCSVSYL